MKKIFFKWTVAAFALVILAGLTAQAQTTNQQGTNQLFSGRLYGLTFVNNQLLSINPTNGDSIVIGTIATNLNGYGLASFGGLLYSFSGNSDLLFEINPTNAAILRTINIGVTNLQGEGDLAFRSDGTGFIATAFTSTNLLGTNGLYSFNLSTGTSHFVATTSVSIDAMAFDSSNTLYALGQDDTNLYIVNQTNGNLTVVGSLGVALASPYAGMGFSSNGTLYAAINDSLYVINKTNGNATAVSTNSDFGYYSVSGLSFTPQYIPFFNNQVSLGGGIYYLGGADGGFGIYTLAFYPYVYQFDLGFEYFMDAGNSSNGAYLYDFTSGTFWYTSPDQFPNLYDYSLNSWIYYFENTSSMGHPNNPREFYNYTTRQFFTK